MRRHPIAAITAALVVLLLAARAACDPVPAPPNTPLVWYHVASSGRLVTDGGTDLRLPAGYFLPEPSWSALDTELRRLQDSETRLAAEVESYKKSTDGWQPGWKTLATAFVAGAVLGYEIQHHLTH